MMTEDERKKTESRPNLMATKECRSPSMSLIFFHGVAASTGCPCGISISIFCRLLKPFSLVLPLMNGREKLN